MTRFWFPLLVLVASIPSVTLLLRGLVWGSDSFAFWSVSCGNVLYANSLSSPVWFVVAIQNIVNCNLIVLAFLMFLFYFLALLGLYFFGKNFVEKEVWRFPFYVALLTPLFFVEVLRFENDFFGWSLALIGLGVFSLALTKKSIILFALSGCCMLFSYQLWQPSIFFIVLAWFLVPISSLFKYVGVLVSLLSILLPKTSYVVGSFTNGIGLNSVAEEIPLVGLVFVLHILHLYKKIPFPLIYYGIFLLLLGALKSKYMFLAVPLLVLGVLLKQQKEGLSFKKTLFGVKEIPVLYVCLILGIGYFFMGLNMYPTTLDLNEMSYAIKLSRDQNVMLYNDWGDGWTFVSLGYDTNYKISYPNPDWNNLPKPFVAWSKEKIEGCVKVSKHIQQC